MWMMSSGKGNRSGGTEQFHWQWNGSHGNMVTCPVSHFSPTGSGSCTETQQVFHKICYLQVWTESPLICSVGAAEQEVSFFPKEQKV
jgi:hypothetical protein